jgi:hypothetical protein
LWRFGTPTLDRVGQPQGRSSRRFGEGAKTASKAALAHQRAKIKTKGKGEQQQKRTQKS